MKTVTILGATGSIGCATLEIVRDQRGRLGYDSIKILALTAQNNWQKLAELACEFQPEFVALANPKNISQLRDALAHTAIEIGSGPAAIDEAAARNANWVMAAITGAAGLRPVLIAAKRGCILALANKEALVCAGSLLTDICVSSGTRLLPVDSEHNAIFQVFDPNLKHRVQKIILTASGGPFRTWSAARMAKATPAQAIAHPIWSMGAKISVDSASLMNKGLEIIEARHLFDVSPDQIEVLVHPQSVVHGLVEYMDGSMLAQLGPADMKVPIASAWAWPERIQTHGERLSLADLGRLDFEWPDEKKFPALQLARQAMQIGGNACNALSAANEVAVASFLQGKIGFPTMIKIVGDVLEKGDVCGASWHGEPESFEHVFDVDERARMAAQQHVASVIE
ncbi:MAG: 1-deoxy-D-xylulose-5-phosphate reductoisomerase [Robiginitomaculum sp.]|nr:1-deoxy-D-xylulose-5-phosphate reductoisomerase [Robiginitomaculum sp.]